MDPSHFLSRRTAWTAAFLAAAAVSACSSPVARAPAVREPAPPAPVIETQAAAAPAPPAAAPVPPAPALPPLPSPAQFLAAAPAGESDKDIFQLTRLHRIRVTMPAGEWHVLQTSSARGGLGPPGTDVRQPDGRIVHTGGGFNGYFPWVHADLEINGVPFRDVGLRYKGNYSFSSSSAAAPFRANLKLKLDIFGGEPDWGGGETFNFHAGVLDPSRMREALAYAIFRAAGVPAPRTAYASLEFNIPGLYDRADGGVYTLIENVNKKFLKENLPPGTGLLFKPEGLRGGVQSRGDSYASYVYNYRPDRDATPHEQRRLIEFAQLISQLNVQLFRERIGSYLDVDAFLRFIAVNALISNTDSYLGGSHNFYLYLDPKDDRFRFIPWDVDLSMGARGGRMGGPGILTPFSGDQALIYWVLEDPANAARYRAILREIAEKIFNREALGALVDEVEKVGTGRITSARDFLYARAAELQLLVATLQAAE